MPGERLHERSIIPREERITATKLVCGGCDNAKTPLIFLEEFMNEEGKESYACGVRLRQVTTGMTVAELCEDREQLTEEISTRLLKTRAQEPEPLDRVKASAANEGKICVSLLEQDNRLLDGSLASFSVGGRLCLFEPRRKGFYRLLSLQ
jgi:hypothetical protein